MSTVIKTPPSTFALGQCAVSRAAAVALGIPTAYTLIARHGQRDWGDVGDEVRSQNNTALNTGAGHIVSTYKLDIDVLVITNYDHGVTVARLVNEEGIAA